VYMATDHSHLSPLALFESHQPLTWLNIRFYFSVCSYPIESPIFLFFGLNLTSQTVLRCLPLVTPDPNGTGLNLVYHRALYFDLSFTFFIWLAPRLFAKHGATGHLYADDIQALAHDSPVNQLTLVSSVDALIQDLHYWMSSNRLCLNSATTN